MIMIEREEFEESVDDESSAKSPYSISDSNSNSD